MLQYTECVITVAPAPTLPGDLGYPLEPWLLTPFRSPASSKEEAFNNAHRRTRVRIEQCFGVLKMRFRCLQRYRTLHFAPDRAGNIVTACAVLHNMCIAYNMPEPTEGGDEEHEEGNDDPLPTDEDSSDEEDRGPQDETLTAQALRIRQRIVQRYF